MKFELTEENGRRRTNKCPDSFLSRPVERAGLDGNREMATWLCMDIVGLLSISCDLSV
jgi:hypothetical protein